MGITDMLSGEFSTGMNGPKLAALRHPGGVHQPALRYFVYRYSASFRRRWRGCASKVKNSGENVEG
jgi:hypothetical protein